MQPQGIEAQVDRLERRVEMLEQLPERLDRLEGHILQFRQETRGEFSAVRAEMHEQGTRLESVFRSEIHALAAHTHSEIMTLGVMLTDKIEKGLAENAAQNRLLYEDLVGRIAALGEASSS